MRLRHLIFAGQISQVPVSPTLFIPHRSRTTSDGMAMMSASLNRPSDFTVHVFVNHDPFIASVLLPDLFSDFPYSAWRLPQEIATPPRPEPMDNHVPESLYKELFVNPRKGLGRYVFPNPFPSSTTIRHLAQCIEQEFSISRKLLASFTIFPQEYLDSYRQPLTWDLTLGEAAMLDHDAATEGQYLEISNRYAPVLHLVIETKAAAIKRVLGLEFLSKALGKEYEYPRDVYNRLESFISCLPDPRQPEIVSQLWRWRGAYYSLQYLEGEKSNLAAQEHADENVLHDIRNKIEGAQRNKEEAKASIFTLASQWENWALKQNYGNDSVIEGLEDDAVEHNVLTIMRQRAVVREWGKSEKNVPLVEALRRAYTKSGKDSNIHDRQQAGLKYLKRSDVATPESEGEWEIMSEEDVSEQLLGPASPSSTPIKALPFRHGNGTLDPTLSTFTIKSGILSWGQILPIYYGSMQENLTNNAARIPDKLEGGTIMRRVYTHKSAARNGEWKVRRYYTAADLYDPAEAKRRVGWVICHSDISPMEVVRRVRAIFGTGPGAVSNGNRHVDKDVLYIGRYDWSYHWRHTTGVEFETKFNDWSGLLSEPQEDSAETTSPTPEQLLEEEKQKNIRDLRFKLQKAWQSIEQTPDEADIPAMADYILQLEQQPDLEASLIHHAKIHKVLKLIIRLESVPRDEEFNIKKRSAALLETWAERLSAEPAQNQGLNKGAVVDRQILAVRKGGYFIALDAADFDVEFVKAYKRDCDKESDKPVEMVFCKGGERFGAFVDHTRVEYELGWLVFSGKRHEEHDANELIAIVYDGAYEAFEGLYHDVEEDPEA